MPEVKNILLVGVGGQGTILASRILSNGLINAGYDVKMSEVHGMAQRGGSVTTQVRYGKQVFSPVIGKGEADILVAFESMEALRWLEYLKPEGTVVVNDYKIPSVPILMGAVDYPEGILDEIQGKVKTTVIKAAEIAEAVGNPRGMNVVLFGALVKAMQLEGIDWAREIAAAVKPKTVEANIKSFQAGLEG